MLLSRGRFWELRLVEQTVLVALSKEGQSDSLPELQVDVPLARWNRVVKHVLSDRKLIGGILLDFARHKEYVAVAVAQDRLYFELQRVVLDATATLIERGRLALAVVDIGMD